MHERANKLRDSLGSEQWKGDAEHSIEEETFTKLHPDRESKKEKTVFDF